MSTKGSAAVQFCELFQELKQDDNANIRCGQISEHVACAWFLSQGYDVFKNISPHGDADIVVRRDGKTIPVDVKTAKPDGSLSAHRTKQAKQIAAGVEIVYVFRDGRCEWGRDVDSAYGCQSGRIPKPLPETPIIAGIGCVGCDTMFVPTVALRRTHKQKYCSYLCARRTRARRYRRQRKLRRENAVQ
jgi:Holliday junction resolvase-like predicted endonuclease